MNDLEHTRTAVPEADGRARRPARPEPGGGLSRDIRRAGLLGGMGALGFLDLLALDDLTTGLQPDYVFETLVLLVSIPALVVLFTLWRRAGEGPAEGSPPEGGPGPEGEPEDRS